MACRIALKITKTYSVTICQQSIICYSNNIYTRYSNKIYTTRNSTIDYFILTTFAQQEIQPSPLLSPNFSVINISPCERSAWAMKRSTTMTTPRPSNLAKSRGVAKPSSLETLKVTSSIIYILTLQSLILSLVGPGFPKTHSHWYKRLWWRTFWQQTIWWWGINGSRREHYIW